jgi:hypothetical protein
MDNIQLGQRDMEWLSVDFDDIVNENEVNIYVFCEGRQMNVVCMCCMKWTCDALMLLGAEMCHLGSMTGLGNFGEF